MHLSHIHKSFGDTRALTDVSLEVRPGELVAVVGENGAGKTTLMRIASGELRPDRGTVAGASGVELVHQHFMLVPELTIAENLALAGPAHWRWISRGILEQEADQIIAASGIELDAPSRPVQDLSVGEKSKLELIKAIARKPRVLVLDEPTSVLTPAEAGELFSVLRTLARKGTAVVLISHKLPEVFALAERIIVLRKGEVVLERRRGATNPAEIAAAMIARHESPEEAIPHRTEPGETLLQIEGLELRRGQLNAIVGVAGNGQVELAERLRATLSSSDAAHVPEDRSRDGIIAEMTIAENLTLRSRSWSPARARSVAEELIARYRIRANDSRQRAGELSGGNQQKVVLARELSPLPSIVIAAEPTRGLDLASAAFVRNELRHARARGAAVLLITSDLDEAFELADMIQVIYRGSLSPPISRGEAPTRVADLMAGIG